MERLTKLDEYGNAYISEVRNFNGLGIDELNRVREAAKKLAAYEDMGIPAFSTLVCKKAIAEWGVDAQTDMLIEEMSELTKALLKLRRIRNKCIDYVEPEKNAVAEEIADVIITLVQQLSILDCYDDVEAIVSAKLRRLNSRLEAEVGDETTI